MLIFVLPNFPHIYIIYLFNLFFLKFCLHVFHTCEELEALHDIIHGLFINFKISSLACLKFLDDERTHILIISLR